MKIIGFIMGNKVLTAVIAIVLVVALYFSFSGVSIEDNDGNVAVTIDNVNAQIGDA